MEVEIVPEPSPPERAAILAALELERADHEADEPQLADDQQE